ncbi:MAG: ABC transporter ATP-binding protein [Saprospiraceae bacterium]|nr:ABC transporter ATP-binding protein [Saprospiraceae bacterium]
MLSIQKLSKSYKGVSVLDVPSLSISDGESFGLVGNNGAGKTTLFSLIMDLIQPSSGEVLSKGKPVGRSEHWKPYTGAYLDESFLIGFLTPQEYFEFVAQLYAVNTGELEERLSKFSDFFHGEILEKKKYIRDLSKGNQKKVGIAAALIGQPELLVLDEPFANLDPSSQIQLKQLIKDLPSDMTVLISSHDLTHITEVCKRIVVLEHGKVIRDITTEAETLTELENYFAGKDQEHAVTSDEPTKNP